MDTKNLTVIYYTSNHEEPSFEKKVREKLLHVIGNLPLISVSHKPINFGENICVGEHKPSSAWLFRQILIGAQAATTPFVITAEADFLYCQDYFAYIPPHDNKIYRYNHIRILYKYHYGFFKKAYSEGAQIAGRKYLTSLLAEKLRGAPEEETKFNPYRNVPFETFGGETACVSFKTGDSLHKYVGVEREKSKPDLPYWGKAENLRKEMFSND